MYEMRYFFFVFFCFVIAFSTSFYALTEANEGWFSQLWFVFNITIRKSETPWEDDSGAYVYLLFFTFIITSMFFTYVLLNLTVSMVKLLYDQNMRIKTEQSYMVMTQLTLDAYDFMTHPEAELFL